LVNPRQIAAGGSFSCALDDNGVTCWGKNNVNQTVVPTLVNPVQVFAGADHACAVDATGIVCWGANWHGKRNAPVINMVRDNDGDGVDDAEDSAPYDATVQ
jgi:alpha-tubulin suppressor-like RCC1 family protein